MRDPKRISAILDLIQQIWMKEPDLRFQQLVYILQSGFSQKHNNVGKIESIEVDGLTKVGYDLFNVEDDTYVDYLKEVANNGL